MAASAVRTSATAGSGSISQIDRAGCVLGLRPALRRPPARSADRRRSPRRVARISGSTTWRIAAAGIASGIRGVVERGVRCRRTPNTAATPGIARAAARSRRGCGRARCWSAKRTACSMPGPHDVVDEAALARKERHVLQARHRATDKSGGVSVRGGSLCHGISLSRAEGMWRQEAGAGHQHAERRWAGQACRRRSMRAVPR